MGHRGGTSRARRRRRRGAGPARSTVPVQPARHPAQRRVHRAGRHRIAVAGVGSRMSDDGADGIRRLLDIMVRLRDPQNGCPWDVQQTFATIAPYTVEEAYEVADAIDRGDLDDLRDELGDLLLQVVFHARMAQEQGAFGFDEVVDAICDKMVRRHPHVFGDESTPDIAAQTIAWEELKRRERAAAGQTDSSALAGIAPGLPEGQPAVKLQKRAARAGLDWPGPAPLIAKLHEGVEEVRVNFQAREFTADVP